MNMKQLKGMSTAQRGFTLVEIAIVLVIVGLLLGGVLQGQALIENSRVRSTISEFDNVRSAILAYQDRYGALPGDDGPAAVFTARGGDFATISASTPAAATARNGLITASTTQLFANGTTNVEGAYLWQHLRAAGMIAGAPTSADRPTNAFGGPIGVMDAAAHGWPAGSNKICFGNIPRNIAQIIDARIDDGASNTGSLRANLAATPNVAAAADYNTDGNYTICRLL
jgi:prepilin-type N-terminal cleavage/methylation domain-containing protein